MGGKERNKYKGHLSPLHPLLPSLSGDSHHHHHRHRHQGNSTVGLLAAGRHLLPSPDSRLGILAFLGFSDGAANKILDVYNAGRSSPRLENRDMQSFPLASALFRVWEDSHEWGGWDAVANAGREVEFAVRNGLNREFAELVDWADGGSPEHAVRHYVMRNVELLKALWWLDIEMNRRQSEAGPH